MDSPFFSIIIPTYNRQHLISRPINSILNQTFNDYEIIIVDDGSSDNTDHLITSMQNKKIRYIKTDNCGVAHARNTGIKLATGKYIGFLDSDDLLEKNHLESAYDYLKENDFPKVIHLNFIS